MVLFFSLIDRTYPFPLSLPMSAHAPKQTSWLLLIRGALSNIRRFGFGGGDRAFVGIR